jgi:cytochrome c-type biogenesis protein CcmH
MVQNGVVTEPARQAYAKLRALEPQAIEPQVWLAIAKEQDGDLAGAASEYRALLAGGGSQEPWKGLLDERLRSVTQRLAGADGAKPKPDGLPDANMAPADASRRGAMGPQDRDKFIGQMVDAGRPPQRRQGSPRWMVWYAPMPPGQREDASSALAYARIVLGDDNRSRLHALAESLGLGS